MDSNTKKKILILVPGENARGGITNYYHSIKKDFTYDVDYFLRGSRTFPFRKSFIKDFFQPIKDIGKFYLSIRKKEYSLLQTSTSLDRVSIIRDGMFIVLAKMYKMKVVVFFRGWDSEFEKIFEKKYLRLFRKLFFRANAFIELSSKHKNLWHLWGYKKNIYLETTLVDKSLVEGLTFEEVEKKYENIEELNILFLARIETNKGVYEAVDTFILLKEKYPRAKLSIAGDGKEINNLVTYIKNRGVKDIVFLGHVSGKQKTDCYKKSHIYLFPSYSEGMPNTVLEAMAFGIPIVTRKVGGLNDFFRNDVNGYFTNSKDPEVFAGFIEKLLDNKELLKAISLNNFKQGQEKFLSDKVAKRIEKIFDEVLDEKPEENKLYVKNKKKKDQKRILILVPGKNARGGISNYYYAIKNGFNMPVDYFVRGARNYPFRRPYFKDVMQAAVDIINFIRIVRKKKHGLVQTSTSLDERSVIRDCVFILIASFYKIDVIVFYRGWKLTFQDRLEKSYLGIFRKVFFKAKIFIVLSREFKEKLLEWGYDKPIYVETTLVDSELIKDFKPENAIKKYSSIASPKLLFLSRVEVAKGIYETIDTFCLLQKKYPDIKMTIAGDGLEEKNVMTYIENKKIKNISILGHVKGEAKINEFLTSHIFILPSYTEGMPVTICEAMAFGLPIVTRKVGGLLDFFENGKNGYFTESKEPEVFCNFIDELLSNPELMKKISRNNYEYSISQFLSTNVARRMENIFEKAMNNNHN